MFPPGIPMMVGCGYCVKRIHDRPYLYVWHYETRGGRREQVEAYVGPAASPRARAEVARLVASYVDRAGAEMARFLGDVRAEMASA